MGTTVQLLLLVAASAVLDGVGRRAAKPGGTAGAVFDAVERTEWAGELQHESPKAGVTSLELLNPAGVDTRELTAEVSDTASIACNCSGRPAMSLEALCLLLAVPEPALAPTPNLD